MAGFPPKGTAHPSKPGFFADGIGGWNRGDSQPKASSIAGGVKVSAPKDEDLDDKDTDSPMIRASKRAKRAKRDAERKASGGTAGDQASAIAKMEK